MAPDAHDTVSRAGRPVIVALAIAFFTGCGTAGSPVSLPPRSDLAPESNVISDGAIAAAARHSSDSPAVTTALRYWQAVELGDASAAYALLAPALQTRLTRQAFAKRVVADADRYVGVPRVLDISEGAGSATVFLVVRRPSGSSLVPGASVVVSRTLAGDRVGGDAGVLLTDAAGASGTPR